jgi:hypothetical protein
MVGLLGSLDISTLTGLMFSLPSLVCDSTIAKDPKGTPTTVTPLLPGTELQKNNFIKFYCTSIT